MKWDRKKSSSPLSVWRVCGCAVQCSAVQCRGVSCRVWIDIVVLLIVSDVVEKERDLTSLTVPKNNICPLRYQSKNNFSTDKLQTNITFFYSFGKIKSATEKYVIISTEMVYPSHALTSCHLNIKVVGMHNNPHSRLGMVKFCQRCSSSFGPVTHQFSYVVPLPPDAALLIPYNSLFSFGVPPKFLEFVWQLNPLFLVAFCI